MVDVDRVRRLAAGGPPPGFPEPGPVVAFSGRLEIRKGPQVLVEAMRAVWDDAPDVQLALFGLDCEWGTGRMSDHLRALAGPYAGRLHLLGPRPPGELWRGLAAADVVALPSHWENFALAALEALAIGCPIVATTGSGFEEFMEDGRNALLVPPRDSAALGQALGRLLADADLRAGLGRGAREVAERYAPDPVGRQHAAFFERVADGRRDGRG
jgi:glycosyltransferase involved in cell wall biosynthesis